MNNSSMDYNLYPNITSEEVHIDEALDKKIIIKCYYSYAFQEFQEIVDDLLLVASTTSTFFNVVVLFCALKLFKRTGDTMHLFIFNMTLGDLLLTAISLPIQSLTRKHLHFFIKHIHLCSLVYFFTWLGLAVSGLSLTLLNVDKLIYFLWPLDYDRTMSKQRAAFLCTIIWGVPFGFVSYVWAFNIVYITDDCTLHIANTRKYFYEVFMVIFCILPVTSSLFVSIYLFRLTHQKRSAYMASSQVDMPTFRTKVKSLVSIFATTVWTSFSLLPYRIFNIYRNYLMDWDAMACEQLEINNWVAWLLLYLLNVHPIVNPIITAIVYAQYRISIKKLLIYLSICTVLHYSYRGEITETRLEAPTDTSLNAFVFNFLSRRQRRAHGNSSTADHEMSSLHQVKEVRYSLNNCDAALTASIVEEPNSNIGEDNVKIARGLTEAIDPPKSEK